MTALATGIDPPPPAVRVRELWAELSATMRLLRTSAGMSLRQAELQSGTGRGTLSQIETGKSRPNRQLVEWYDTALGGDGLLLTIFAEARGAHGPERTTRQIRRSESLDSDRYAVVAATVPFGQIVTTGTAVRVGWTLRNTGRLPWRDWRLVRIGALAGVRLLVSEPWTAVPDCAPGAEVTVGVDVAVPSVAATYAAYWVLADGDGEPVQEFDELLSATLVAR